MRLMEIKLPGVIVMVAVAVKAPEVAVMVVVQVVATVVAAVTTPVLLTVAQLGVEDVQVTVPVRFLVLPSSKLPVATMA